jgi:N-acetylglutamate synthase-like GNAT family acetyltransferase
MKYSLVCEVTKIKPMSDNEMIVRRIMHNDIDAVLTLIRKIGQGHHAKGYRDLLLTDPGRTLDFSFVCEYKGMLVGVVLARLEHHVVPPVDTCVIKGIAIDADFQKRGIGSKLVSHLLNHCYNQGIPKTRAFLYEGETDLARFFERLSFKRSKIINYDADFEYLPSEFGTR